jgi:outer membrane receptor protein involved in Fe transport
LDPAAFGFPAVNVDTVPNYDDAAVALTGLLLQSYSNFNFDKQGVALPEGTPVPRHFRDHELEFYAQDSWRATPNLKLTYGLRYSLLQPPYETTGTQAAPTTSLNDFFNRRATAMAAGLTYDPLITFDLSGQANGRKPYWAWDYKNFAPRVAIAWSPHNF